MVRDRKKSGKNKPAAADFKKAKVRVGRRISKKTASKYNNVVDTSIHSKAVVVRTHDDSLQSNNRIQISEKREDRDDVDYKALAITLAKNLPIIDHHNVNVRKQALVTILHTLQEFGSRENKTSMQVFPKEFLPLLIEKLRVRITDEETQIRNAVNDIIEFLFSNQKFSLDTFIEMLILSYIVGASSLIPKIRLSSIQGLMLVIFSKFNMLDLTLVSKIWNVLRQALKLSNELVGYKKETIQKHFDVVLQTSQFCLRSIVHSFGPESQSVGIRTAVPLDYKYSMFEYQKVFRSLDFEKYEVDFREEQEQFSALHIAAGFNTGDLDDIQANLNSILESLMSLWKMSIERGFPTMANHLEHISDICLNLIRIVSCKATISQIDPKQYKAFLQDFPFNPRGVSKQSVSMLRTNLNFAHSLYYFDNDKDSTRIVDFLADAVKLNFGETLSDSIFNTSPILEKSYKFVLAAAAKKTETLPQVSIKVTQILEDCLKLAAGHLAGHSTEDLQNMKVVLKALWNANSEATTLLLVRYFPEDFQI